MEEPRITMSTVDNFKQLLGGEVMEIQVKHKDAQPLQRIPIFVSTNTPIGFWLSNSDQLALASRTITYCLDKQIKHKCDNENLQSGISQPPGNINSYDLYDLIINNYYGGYTDQTFYQ